MVEQEPISEPANEAVKPTLRADEEDLEAYRERRNEPSLSFDEVVQKLKRDGRL